jgi:hypothetical protein
MSPRFPVRPKASRAAARPFRKAAGTAPPVERRPRVVPLPEGACRVPISTIDWLVSRESPAARYVVLRDLLGRPGKDPELKRARQALPRDPWVRDVLGVLRKRVEPGASRADLLQKYEGGLWLTLFLAETGADASLPVLRHAADVLFAGWEKELVELSRHRDAAIEVGSFAALCRALALIGHAGDPRVLAGADYVARGAMLGRATTAKALLLFAALPEEKRSPLVMRATDFLVARALDVELPRDAGPTAPRENLRAGFPTGETSDVPELLYALALAAPERSVSPRKGSLGRALSLLLSRADHRSRWKLERELDGRLPFVLERTGEMSRWVTHRALVTLQRFLGLSIEGAAPRSRMAVR